MPTLRENRNEKRARNPLEGKTCRCGKPATCTLKSLDGSISYECSKCLHNFSKFCDAMNNL